MTCELHSTFEASGIEWPALRNHIACMAHVIHLALGAFMSSIGAKAPTNHGKSMNAFSNMKQMKALTSGRVKDFEIRESLESTRCRP